MRDRGRWLALAVVLAGSFAVLGGLGPDVHASAPPIPARVAARDGRALFDGDAIRRGQNVWQSMGGQEVGTVWGHGAYVAPGWAADWLHRESTFMLDRWLRVPGDTVFALGALVLAWFVLGLRTGWSLAPRGRVAQGSTEVTAGEPEPAGRGA